MRWSVINFFRLIEKTIEGFLQGRKNMAFLKAIITPLATLYENIFYRMQHDGRTIYLEKLLNEYFNVTTYDTQNHDGTKLIYIEDLPKPPTVYVFQDEESETIWLDDDEEDDVFLEAAGENVVTYSWVIFIPDTFPFQEAKVRALVNSYRYYGKKYKIETYTL